MGKSHLVQAIGYQAIKAGFYMLYRSIFDVVRDFLYDEAFAAEDKTLAQYLKPDLLIVNDMGMKQLPKARASTIGAVITPYFCNSNSQRIVRGTYPIWLYFSVTGVVVYLMFYRLCPAAGGL